MTKEVNVLIFPAGSENAINIYNSLKYNLHFNIFGASGKADHCEFIYPKEKLFIGNLYIKENNFIDEFNKVIGKFNIDYIIPTHDIIAAFLTKHCNTINAKLISSPYETARIAENKKVTYDVLKNEYFYPKVYQSIDEVTKYPVFLKPYIGVGGKGTYLINNKQDLKTILKKNSNLLICEYLPGKEYTVDCFTNKNGELLFVGPRKSERITIGIDFHSERAEYNKEFESIAEELNNKFKFNGAWFFQVKEDEFNNVKFMEFSVRQAATMDFYRQLGVNFTALSLFDAMGYDVKIIFNNYNLISDRFLKINYYFDYMYDKLYVNFEDTLIIDGSVNTTLIKVIYQCINANKKIILLTKHAYKLDQILKKYRINNDLFDVIIFIEPNKKKADYIDNLKSVFIDNSFIDRLSVKELCNIPVFDVDAVECLINSCAI